MFTRMDDIERMFGAMDMLRNKMDSFFDGFNRPYLHRPSFSRTKISSRTRITLSENSRQDFIGMHKINKAK